MSQMNALRVITMIALISLPMSSTTTFQSYSILDKYDNNNNPNSPISSNELSTNGTFTAKGRISGLVYTTPQKNVRTVESRVTPPDMLLGTWYWKAEEGKTTDFKANISKISTVGNYDQLIEVFNFKTIVPSIFSYNYMQVRGTADAKLYLNDVLKHNYINTNITIEPRIGKALKTIKITMEDPPLKIDLFREKSIYGVSDYFVYENRSKI